MAKKARKRAAEIPSNDQVSAKPAIRTSEDTLTYYINHIEVGHSRHEFVLNCGRLPAIPTAEQIAAARETGALTVEADVRLIIPPTMMVGLLDALTKQREKYEKACGITLKS
jgi:hypothetical protein